MSFLSIVGIIALCYLGVGMLGLLAMLSFSEFSREAFANDTLSNKIVGVYSMILIWPVIIRAFWRGKF